MHFFFGKVRTRHPLYFIRKKIAKAIFLLIETILMIILELQYYKRIQVNWW
jgi:hypothetical protein